MRWSDPKLRCTVSRWSCVETSNSSLVRLRGLCPPTDLMYRESLAIRAAALEETLAETRAERGQLENYKQLARETEAAKVGRACMDVWALAVAMLGRTSAVAHIMQLGRVVAGLCIFDCSINDPHVRLRAMRPTSPRAALRRSACACVRRGWRRSSCRPRG